MAEKLIPVFLSEFALTLELGLEGGLPQKAVGRVFHAGRQHVICVIVAQTP
jgi:hypothetical protein